jgi:hypothetical protein
MARSRIEGVDELKRALKKAGASAPIALAAGMVEEQEKMMAAAKDKTPVAPDGGTLRASGTVLPPEIKGTNITVAAGFGGAASKYALAVHEHLSEHSPPSWIAAEKSGKGVHFNVSGTGPKFLESAFLERRPGIGRRLAVTVRATLKRLGK